MMGPTPRRQIATGAIAVTLTLLAAAIAVPSGAAAAAPPLLRQFCDGTQAESLVGAGNHCFNPGGVASDPASGDLDVADIVNQRIQQFTPWGVFQRAFGGGVVTGGAAGVGTVSAGSKTVTSVTVTERGFEAGMLITGAGIAAGTTIASVGVGTLELSEPAIASAAGTSLSVAPGTGNVSLNERQTVTVSGSPSGGSFTLTFVSASFRASAAPLSNHLTATSRLAGMVHVGDAVDPVTPLFPGGATVTEVDPTVGSVSLSAANVEKNQGQSIGFTATETTALIPHNAPAAEVAAKLEALPAVGAADVSVSGPVGGPYSIEFTGSLLGDTNVAQMRASGAGLTPSGSVLVATPVQGAGAFEVCSVIVDCRGGIAGSGAGQLDVPVGIAINADGDIFAVEYGNPRVQKFDSEGHFLLMFGGEVDKTTSANVCTAASGDVCGAGVEGTANGQFGALKNGNYIAVGPGGKVYVGDQERIQVFDENGNYLESLPLPGETVQSLAVDTDPSSPSAGDIYVALFQSAAVSKANVRKLSPAGASIGELEVESPRAIATDAKTGDVYVVQAEGGKREVLEFDAAGNPVGEGFGKDVFTESEGLAVSSTACEIEGADIVVANQDVSGSFIRLYGPPPDIGICPPPPVPPSIDDQLAVSADSEGATVKARINPHFWTPTTRYYVQYGTGRCSEGGCTAERPAAPGSLLAGPVTEGDLPTAGVFLSGLKADTTYHYRFVAQSDGGGPVAGIGGEVGKDGAESAFHTSPAAASPGSDACPNAAFRTGAGADLPDCRAYEMVSPVDKNNGDIATRTTSFAQASTDGERLTFSALRAFGEPESAPLISQFLAERSGSGWSSRSISAPRNTISLYPLGGINFQYKAFSPDLCDGWVVQDTDVALVPAAPPHVPNLYRRDLCGEEGYELLSSAAPPDFGFEPLGSGYYPEPQGASADGAHSVFRADDALTPDAAPGKEAFQLYETYEGGKLRLLSVLPSTGSAAGKASTAQVSAGTASVANGQGVSNLDSVVHAISADGSRVYWTASGASSSIGSGGHGGGAGKLYLRVNATEEESKHNGSGKCTQPSKACTYPVSGLASPSSAQFWSASPDGARAIFSIEEELLEFEATEEGGALKTKATLIAKGFKGFMGASDDAGGVYFVSSEELAAGAIKGKPNLYLHRGGAGFTFVGTLSSADVLGLNPSTAAPSSPIAPLPYKRTSRVSPDGLHAAFMSTASLTGFDNTDADNGEADAEVFLFDAAAEGGKGKLLCASCNPRGVRPTGRNVSPVLAPTWAAAQIPGWTSQSQPSRLLSDDGRRLFFNSLEPLVSRDTNGRQDVYQWEASTGKAQCLEDLGGELFVEESGGCLSLISSGQSPEDSEFLDASPSGSDVFFATDSGLLPQDTGLIDVYDARQGGGFPPPPPPPPPCVGDGCQSVPSPPSDPTPASASFRGAANPTASRGCPKGKRRVKSRCVAKRHADHRRKHRAHTDRRAQR